MFNLAITVKIIFANGKGVELSRRFGHFSAQFCFRPTLFGPPFSSGTQEGNALRQSLRMVSEEVLKKIFNTHYPMMIFSKGLK